MPELALGNNRAPQVHAESALENCFGAHWGLDGLKPYMRYSLAGGYQANKENSWAHNYCPSDVPPISDLKQALRQAMDSFMESPGHRRNILDPDHRKVSLGLAWSDRYAAVYQHFEGDYVEFDELPSIKTGVLTLAGRVRGGVWFPAKDNLQMSVFYDPPPRNLGRGQLARTYCSTLGPRVASFRWPLPNDQQWPDREFRYYDISGVCPDPYAVPAGAPPPSSWLEEQGLYLAAWGAYLSASGKQPPMVTIPWITALRWEVTVETFHIEADLSELTAQHGPGVYTVMVWWSDRDDYIALAQYSIFYRATPPESYGDPQ